VELVEAPEDQQQFQEEMEETESAAQVEEGAEALLMELTPARVATAATATCSSSPISITWP